jgi:hypothetical protein
VWVVVGVAVGIALLVYKCTLTIGHWGWLDTIVSTVVGIFVVVITGCAEIHKISWLDSAQRLENAPIEVPAPDSVPPPSPPSRAIKRHVNPQVTTDERIREMVPPKS